MIEDIFSLSQNFIKLYNREYIRYFLKEKIFQSRFSILIGGRGVGKTTAIIQYLLGKYKDIYNKKILYVPSDHVSIGTRTLYEIAESFYSLGGELISFDEIHKYPSWSAELKSICDTFPKLKIIASGSSTLKVEKGTHDLARRAIVYHLPGLSFREYIELRYRLAFDRLSLEMIMRDHERHASGIIDTLLKNKMDKILSLFKEYLHVGYYPYSLEYDDRKLFYVAIEQDMHTTLESDLSAVYPSITGASIVKIKKLLGVIADSVPFTPDLHKLKNLLDIGDERTLKIYFKYLEDAGLIQILSASGKGLKILEKPGKIYLGNTNQIYALETERLKNIGNVRETFFLNSLSVKHNLGMAAEGDFLIDTTFTFEVGGKNKNFSQIRNTPNSYLAIDDIEIGSGKRIPLWIFGFLY